MPELDDDFAHIIFLTEEEVEGLFKEEKPCSNCGRMPVKQYKDGKFLRWIYPDCLTYDSEFGLYYYEC